MLSTGKKTITSVLLVCVIVLHAAMAWAQASASASALSLPHSGRFTVQRFGEQLGLGVVTVTTMAQDQQGFLWVGTQTGLFRYDGARVQRWPEVDKIAGHYIDQILIAPDQTVWVKGSVGVGYFTQGHFERFPLPADVKPLGISEALALDHGGNLFLAVEKGLLRAEIRNPANARVFTHKDGLPGRIANITLESTDSVWFTSEHRLGHFAAGAAIFEIDRTIMLPNEPSYGLLFDGSGSMWLRTANHLLRIEPERHRFSFDDYGVPPANTDAPPPTLDRNGNLLVPSSAGLYWHDRGHWRAITDKEGLTSNAVQTALEDREGTLWVGSSGSGLDRLMGFREWRSWTKAEGLPDNSVWQTVRDRRGRLWVATVRGIAIWEGERWKILTAAQGLCGTEVRQLEMAGDGYVWAFSPVGGLTRIDPQTLHAQCFRGFAGRRFLHVVSAPGGEIWASAARGTIVRFEGRGASIHPVELQLPERVRGDVWYLTFSPDNVLWASGPDRVFSFDGKNWRIFTTRDGMLGGAVTSIAPLSGTLVWIAYVDVSGVSQLRVDANGAPHFEHHNWDVGVVGVDSHKRVWFDGTSGIMVVGLDGDIETLNHADGLVWDDLSPMGVREEPDGSFMISTTRGLSRYTPGPQSGRRVVPRVEFTSILLAGKDRLGAVLPEVTYKEGTLAVQFTPSVLGSPDKIACRYRLNGLEREFATTDLREVRYSGLPPGYYQLEVQCRGNSPDWPANAATFEFTVRPPWWQTWWAYLLSVLVGVGLMWIIVVLRTRTLNQRRIELEAAVAQRSAELLEKNNALQEASLTDPLTQTRNRRYFYETVPSEAARVLRLFKAGIPGLQTGSVASAGELIIVMADIDMFKRVNDVHGHSIGDRLLQEHAQRLASVIRKGDVLVRWGGEEFMIVCHATPRENVPMLCQRLMEAVSATPFNLGAGVSLNKTCSFGWAPFPWSREQINALSVENVIELADKGLYLAKTGGKNQAVGILPATGHAQAGLELAMPNLLELPPALVQVVRTTNLATGLTGAVSQENKAQR